MTLCTAAAEAVLFSKAASVEACYNEIGSALHLLFLQAPDFAGRAQMAKISEPQPVSTSGQFWPVASQVICALVAAAATFQFANRQHG
jgi:hypothetical protein